MTLTRTQIAVLTLFALSVAATPQAVAAADALSVPEQGRAIAIAAMLRLDLDGVRADQAPPASYALEDYKKALVALRTIRIALPPAGEDFKECETYTHWGNGGYRSGNDTRICRATLEQGPRAVAQALIHEAIHRADNHDECEVKAFEVNAFKGPFGPLPYDARFDECMPVWSHGAGDESAIRRNVRRAKARALQLLKENRFKQPLAPKAWRALKRARLRFEPSPDPSQNFPCAFGAIACVDSRDRRTVYIRDPAVPLPKLTQTLIHESVHLAGIRDECVATGFETTVSDAMGHRPYRTWYKCF